MGFGGAFDAMRDQMVIDALGFVQDFQSLIAIVAAVGILTLLLVLIRKMV